MHNSTGPHIHSFKLHFYFFNCVCACVIGYFACTLTLLRLSNKVIFESRAEPVTS